MEDVILISGTVIVFCCLVACIGLTIKAKKIIKVNSI